MSSMSTLRRKISKNADERNGIISAAKPAANKILQFELERVTNRRARRAAERVAAEKARKAAEKAALPKKPRAPRKPKVVKEEVTVNG